MKSKKYFIIPLILTVIPSLICLAFLMLFVISERKECPTEIIICFVYICFLSPASLISLIILVKCDIDYYRIYLKTLLSNVVLILCISLTSLTIFILDLQMVAIIYIIILPAISFTLIIKNILSFFEKKNIRQAFLIAFVNPLPYFLSIMIPIAYEFINFNGFKL